LLLAFGLLIYGTIESLVMALFIAIIFEVLIDPLHSRLAAC